MDSTNTLILAFIISLTNEQHLTIIKSSGATKLAPLSSTLPASLSQRCTSGWSRWINDNYPTSNYVSNFSAGSDVEGMSESEQQVFCGTGNITSIQCETVDGIPFYSSGEILSCTIGTGLVCEGMDNAPIPCSDYRVRYYCSVDKSTCLSSTYFSITSTSQVITNSFLGMTNISESASLDRTIFHGQTKKNTLGTGATIAIIIGIIVVALAIIGAFIGVVHKKKSRKHKVGQQGDF